MCDDGSNCNQKPEALRLADTIEEDPTTTWAYREAAHAAAAELRRLHADVEELDGLRERLADLLSRTAVALKGPEPPLTRWDWSDLPKRVLSLHAVNQELLEALRTARDHIDMNALEISHCKDAAAIRAAIAKAEGQA
jgi:hypothetical protein